MSQENDPQHFTVHPSVVFQLGESLISDSVQALMELVKNSYDADATYVKIKIDTQGTLDIPSAKYAPTGGRIVVEDNGHGMDENTIKRGWLSISNRTKREMKMAQKTTARGRTPLGDKGLGRLGVQRLGESLDIFTRSTEGPCHHLALSWLDFETAPTLADVNILLERSDELSSPGTQIVVSDLAEPDFWRGNPALKHLEKELSRMISPFSEIRDFDILIEVDGITIELAEISNKVRAIAPIRYNIGFDGSTIDFRGRAKLDFFRPPNAQDAEEFALAVESDGGKAFFTFLTSQREAEALHLSQPRHAKWFVEFRWHLPVESLDAVEWEPTDPPQIASPGPFSGEVDAFDLSATSFGHQSVFDALREYREHVKELSGIRVYRDGFAVRVAKDWLGLGGQWTSARSYYGLKPDSTIGYIALTASDNMALEETTDREGFRDTLPFRTFYAILSHFVSFTSEAQRFFGRSWVEFKKNRREREASVDARKDVHDIALDLSSTLSAASKQRKAVSNYSNRATSSLTQSTSALKDIVESKDTPPSLKTVVRKTLKDLVTLSDNTHGVLQQVTSYLDDLQELGLQGQVLADRAEGMVHQMDDMYEAVALGLTAEAVSHELFNVAENLAKRTTKIQSSLREKAVPPVVMTYIEHVHSAIAGLRKQLSFLSPSLRYVRDKKEDLHLPDILSELQDFYSARLQEKNISLTVLDSSQSPFTVRMNRGRFQQIIDNFVRNSEYWLGRDIEAGRIKAGAIDIELERPFIRISDNGRGVDPTIEPTLFQPFMSAKKRGQGRGLGLFISRQLLDANGCSVSVVPKRNSSNRLYMFQIDMRGALHE